MAAILRFIALLVLRVSSMTDYNWWNFTPRGQPAQQIPKDSTGEAGRQTAGIAYGFQIVATADSSSRQHLITY
jgi:hypothetical protein